MTTTGRALLLSKISEREWQGQVRRWAQREGWHVHAVFDSRHSPEGWPDLFLMRNGRAVAAELKSMAGRLTPAQTRTLVNMRECGIETYVWRPADEDEVRRVLGGDCLMSTKSPLAIRFWAKVEKSSGCWRWVGAIGSSGYGSIWSSRPQARCLLAHRVAYELVIGPIPVGLELDHLCRNRRCVRPDHLETVTHRVNDLRGISEPARYAARSECGYGHAFNERNTRMRRGRRACRACDARRQREYQARKVAA